AGTHIHYQQYLKGLRVIGGGGGEKIRHDGRLEMHENLARAPLRGAAAEAGGAPPAREMGYLHLGGAARAGTRSLVEERPYPLYANYYDAASGALMRSDALFWTAQGRVFDPNPVAKLNRPDLQDQNDSASAVPESAYSIVDLLDLPASGPLIGPNVQI